jgi:hypothetical protein
VIGNSFAYFEAGAGVTGNIPIAAKHFSNFNYSVKLSPGPKKFRGKAVTDLSQKLQVGGVIAVNFSE